MAEDVEVDECLPEAPQEPQDSDCCGTGCTPCVFDIYEQELKLWRAECERIKQRRDGIKRNDAKLSENTITPDRYKTFEIEKITKETHHSNTYRFKVPNDRLLGLDIGHHLILRWQSEESSVTRQYTPIKVARGYFDVVIKIYENGPMSQFIKTWKVGDTIEWRGPFGNLIYKPNTFHRVIMLAAGTGIAPMIPVIREILENEEDETFVTLLYACKNYDNLLCKKQLDEWQQFWNFNCLYALSQEYETGTRNIRYGDKILYERIREATVREHIGDKVDRTLVLICGTRSFDKDMVNYVKRCGIPDEKYFKF